MLGKLIKIGVGLVVLLVVGFFLPYGYAWVISRGAVYEGVEDLPEGWEAEAVVVPGAQVLGGGKMSLVLFERAERAKEVYEKGRAGKILISGDHRSQYYDEVTPVRDYLMKEGVREEDILMDGAGVDTYNTLKHAKNHFGFKRVVVATQGFHMPRVVLIGQGIGLEVKGVEAERYNETGAGQYWREVVAMHKAVYEILSGAEVEEVKE